MRIIASFSPKGGVGSTTTAVHLALQSASEGHRTLLWDLDSQAAASYYLGVKPALSTKLSAFWTRKKALQAAIQATSLTNFQVLPGAFKLRKTDQFLATTKRSGAQLQRLLDALQPSFDYCILDCPSGFSLLTENILNAAHALVVPVRPSHLSVRALDQIQKFVGKRSPELKKLLILPFFSIVDLRKGLHKEMVEIYANGRKRFMRSLIPQTSSIERTGHDSGAIWNGAMRPTIPTPFVTLWQEIHEQLELHERVQRIKMW